MKIVTNLFSLLGLFWGVNLPVPARADFESWYTITLTPKPGQAIPYAYYTEKLKTTGKDQIQYQYQMWRLEEDFINEEQLGIVAASAPTFFPKFFNYRSLYRSTETLVDGTLKDGVLQVKVRKGDESVGPIKKVFPKKGFLSNLFTSWIIHNGPKEAGKTISYVTVFEDNFDQQFTPVYGKVTLLKPDQIGGSKYLVSQTGVDGTWWIDSHGSLIRMESQSNHRLVERTTKEKAQQFLKGKTK